MVEERECSCCLEGISAEEIMALPCSHLLHVSCFNIYLRSPSGRSGRCPLCRCEIFDSLKFSNIANGALVWEELLYESDNDVEFVKEILGDFKAELLVNVPQLSEAIRAKNLKDAVYYSEYITGSSLLMKARKVASCGRTLMKSVALSEEEWANAQDLRLELSVEAEILNSAIDDFCGNVSDTDCRKARHK